MQPPHSASRARILPRPSSPTAVEPGTNPLPLSLTVNQASECWISSRRETSVAPECFKTLLNASFKAENTLCLTSARNGRLGRLVGTSCQQRTGLNSKHSSEKRQMYSANLGRLSFLGLVAQTISS